MISNKIYTNTYDDNRTWLQAYTQALKESSDSEKANEKRENYSHPTQTYADYLDYKEEWEYASEEMLNDVQKSYIYRIASTNQRLECQCGETHILGLSRQNTSKITVVDDSHTTPWTQCWFKAITQKFQGLKEKLAQGAASFPNVIERNLTEIVQWKLAKTGRTPTLLPYETYKEVWWNIDVNGGSTELSTHIVSLMRTRARDIVAQREIEVRKPVAKRYFFPSEDILNDHGFHTFMRSQQSTMGDILKYLNRLRRQVGYYKKNLRVGEVERSMSDCEKCRQSDVCPQTSPFGIYCAPPGAGKTTAQEKETLVGFDTDWVGIGPTWRDYSYLLRKGIPIITNQVSLFRGAGVKIQLAVKRAIRKDAHGRPMADYREVVQLGRDNPDTYVLYKMRSDEFLSDYVVQMTAMAHLQVVNQTLLINKRSIWDASDGQKEYLNEFGRKMRDLAVGRQRVFSLT